MKQNPAPVLEVIDEVRIADLLMFDGRADYEASGVHLKDGYLYIVFDNDASMLRLRPGWHQAAESPILLGLNGSSAGYEDLTYQPDTRTWYCLIESVERKPGLYLPRLDEFDESFHYVRSHWLNFPLKSDNKGFEGLSSLRYQGEDYLLCLCEGNDCKGGKAGQEPGKGRIQVFRWQSQEWVHSGAINLPQSVRFKDYASLDLRQDCITVISQASSALWIGQARQDADRLDRLIAGDGQTFLFPRDDSDRILYCNLEGVTWLGDDRLAVVSDKGKPDQPGRCARKEQSIHICRLPGGCLPEIRPSSG